MYRSRRRSGLVSKSEYRFLFIFLFQSYLHGKKQLPAPEQGSETGKSIKPRHCKVLVRGVNHVELI